MSGLIPDIANWAFRGGNNSNDENENEPEPQMSAAELRAQRLARLEQMQQTQQPEPMDIDPPKKDSPKSEATPSPAASPPPQKPQEVMVSQTKKKKTELSPSDASKKQQRKKELLIKKVLEVTLVGGVVPSDPSCKEVDLDGSTEINEQTITDVIATRLNMEESPNNNPVASQRPSLIFYLGQCHRRASEEIKTMLQSKAAKAPSKEHQEMLAILQEIQKQVTNYAGSCLMVPGLFLAADDAVQQLARCLVSSVSDQSASITFGVTGKVAHSFYYSLCEELIHQDESVFASVIEEVVKYISELLSKFKTVFDGNTDGSAVIMVSALSAVCTHKKAAEAITRTANFLLPAEGTLEASQVIRPAMLNPVGGAASLLQMLGGADRPYQKRSGPALEKNTILGLVLRVGLPKNNTSFSPTSVLRQSVDTVNKTFRQQRQHLRVQQEAAYSFVLNLIKGGPNAKSNVMQWFADALLVNYGASAMQPDPSKVSNSSLLLNMSVILLKLCEPFVNDPTKHHLIDPGFVSSMHDHRGVFEASGDRAVTRLGEGTDQTMTEPYKPKNEFIPQCFFFCARSFHYGISPLLSFQENLLRRISYTHWDMQQNNRDIQSDPQFAYMVSKQRSLEVALYQEEMVTDTLRFCDLIASVILGVSDSALRTMPEDFVSDVCHIIMSIAKLKSKLLAGIDFRNVFKMVVKLLSAQYAPMVRNYNLRARMGDVLYELFLPTDADDRRDVPASVSEDPLAGGKTYLLSDPAAQESLAPSLLLLYGEVEHTGYYDKMSHRAKIASLIKYLWESAEHRSAFRRITQNKESFIKFANGIMNETNTLIATVMQKLPEIRSAQEQMKNVEEWGRLSEEEQSQITSRLEDSEREVKSALPLCNKTVQMFGYLNTDPDIRSLFLLEELCPRLVGMLLHVLTKLVGSRGLELKVDNPEQYEFRPKEMLRDLCAIFSLFAAQGVFQLECARAGCDPSLLQSAVKTCRRLNLITGESMTAFESLPGLVEEALKMVNQDAVLTADAPDDFLDEILATYMKDPVELPSGHFVDRSTITQHLLNDPIDPFSREPMTVNDIKPAIELKARMDAWLAEKRRAGS
ncbi:ubiquitin conjugation factor E4 B [Fistulifera solaris]|uniref:RING-type E3 ubiquitin transferase n=1 Tax=Fistulifera solaris TaxID=1519565 RepID=A0A1Z5K952_FISSO|nr:ubiquitin conjugation factor E4 B [Fistulifera solaris]|eukprot:GAX22651.1 ubiquitin conjugation factor E4 B [Fistulifera solaris]